MTQTIALLVDAYRELNAKKLFWVTLILSGVLVGAFACVGLDAQGITIFKWSLPVPMFNTRTMNVGFFYKFLFLQFGVALWLAWAAMILAVISTAAIIPDFVSGGAVELALSKPIGRVRLFLTKYVMGLLFVTLQVGVFSLASFLVIGLRGGAWEVRLFLAVPIVVGVFSFLFCVSALVGLLTRSTIAALLLTLLFWIFLFILNAADSSTLMIKSQKLAQVARQERMIERQKKEIERLEHWAGSQLDDKAKADALAKGETEPGPGAWTSEQLEQANPQIAGVRSQIAATEKDIKENQDDVRQIERWNRGFVIAKTVLPKTAETTKLLERVLLSEEDIEKFRRTTGDDRRARDDEEDAHVRGAEMAEKVLRSRSVGWIAGTSLAFEGVVLVLACWIFARRDF
ncbi:MAG: hypothetical protein U0638_03510 [Phycisphaerales bacterium]